MKLTLKRPLLHLSHVYHHYISYHPRKLYNHACFKQLSTITSDMKNMLLSLPDYTNAIQHINNHDIMKAIPLLYRVHDVMMNAMGASSPLTIHTNIILAKNLIYDGKHQKSHDLLLKTIDNMDVSYHRGKIICLQTLSYIKLLQGHHLDALSYAEDAIEFLEATSSHADAHVDLFHSGYGLAGIASLYEGKNLTYTESMLQSSARWSQDDVSMLIAYNNLGSMHWLSSYDRQRHRIQQFSSSSSSSSSSSPSSSSSSSPTSSSSSHDLNKMLDDDVMMIYGDQRAGSYHDNAKVALQYWDEAVAVANKIMIEKSSGCAPSPLSSPSSSSSGSSSSSSASPGDNDILTERLKDIHYAQVYTSILCNIAEAYESIGEPSKASDMISSALSSSNHHHHHLMMQPYLGRILGLMAYHHMHKKLAVSSEGFYRSAIEKFQHSQMMMYDNRHAYDHQVVVGGYGKLLTQWDKREEHGEELISSAMAKIEKLPHMGALMIYPSQVISYPIIPDLL